MSTKAVTTERETEICRRGRVIDNHLLGKYPWEWTPEQQAMAKERHELRRELHDLRLARLKVYKEEQVVKNAKHVLESRGYKIIEPPKPAPPGYIPYSGTGW